MVAILIMSAIFATLGLLKMKVFWNNVMTSEFLSMTSPTKFYDVTQNVL